MEKIKSYSQLGEDIFTFQNFLNKISDDVCILEIGAYDGVTYSNTLMYETLNGVGAILVEPSPVSFRKIIASRPKSKAHNCAISSGFGTAEFSGNSAVSGITDKLTAEYIERWKIGEMDSYKVLTVPLQVILEIENVKYIDFISIDVQGAELDVLETMDWSIPVNCICIELEGHQKDKDELCRNILRSNGFVFKDKLHISEFWYHPDYYRLNEIYDPSLTLGFDRFEPLFMKDVWIKNLASKFK